MNMTVSQCRKLAESDTLKDKFKNQEKMMESFSNAVGAICKTIGKVGEAICKTIVGNAR